MKEQKIVDQTDKLCTFLHTEIQIYGDQYGSFRVSWIFSFFGFYGRGFKIVLMHSQYKAVLFVKSVIKTHVFLTIDFVNVIGGVVAVYRYPLAL